MLLVPCIVYALVTEQLAYACALFIAAAATDCIDGALARLLDEQTQLGALLDPVADKLLLLSSFFTLAYIDSPLFSIPWWFVGIVLVRELVIVGGVIVCYWYTRQWRIEPTRLGKMTTAVQVSFIVWLFACYFFAWLPVKTYKLMLGIIAMVELISLAQYVRIGVRQLHGIQR